MEIITRKPIRETVFECVDRASDRALRLSGGVINAGNAVAKLVHAVSTCFGLEIASSTAIADVQRSSGTQTCMRCMSWTAWSSLHRPACPFSHQPSLSKRSLFAAGHVKKVTHRNIQHHNQACANSRRHTKVQAGSTAPAKSRSGKASSRKKASVVGSPHVDFQLQRNLLTNLPAAVHTGREVEAV